jgi:hypothetical protein
MRQVFGCGSRLFDKFFLGAIINTTIARCTFIAKFFYIDCGAIIVEFHFNQRVIGGV